MTNRTSFSCALWACAIFMLMLALLAPMQAFAAQPRYSIDSLSTEVYVETDTSIRVIERQKLTFDGPSEGVVWYLHVPESGESVKIDAVRAAAVDSEGALAGDWVKLQLVDSHPETQGKRPGDSAQASLRQPGAQPWYSYNISDGMVRSYFPADRGTYLIETDYVVSGRARMFRDVGELYWRYLDSDTPTNVGEATLRIALPVPAGEVVTPDSTVVAWGHGPSNGTFSVDADGSVVYRVENALAGHYAEAHIIFPSHWLANVSHDSPAYHTERRRDAAVAEEADWLDANARGSIWDNHVRVMFGAFILLALLFTVVTVAVLGARGREDRARVWVGRVAATLLIVALAEASFFGEPITTAMLLVASAVLALAMLGIRRDDAGEGEAAADLQTVAPDEGDAVQEVDCGESE